eukprot:TRINITY_DN387_c0_g1_i3.p1 TRINITY_DN387_c0_g1~~TRINITY_DN387_c0_g1_i3.p1  ORF type:complete len:309 (-),score=42.82 TRINITY_DN387_c0_g1_i3:38-877(-)
MAGALAGTAEHTGMFPVDTIKTHMQANESGTSSSGFFKTAETIWRTKGIRGFFRGISAIISSAAPAHAIYFTTYEYSKVAFGAKVDGSAPSVALGLSGAVATILSDAVLTPGDTVKQRCQLSAKQYSGPWECMRSVIRYEGVRFLWAGYTTTLFMNVPFHVIYLNVYEPLRSLLVRDRNNYHVTAHIISGGGAGIVAACLTNPLDVVKTRLQTQGDVGKYYSGMIKTLLAIYKTEGTTGLFLGVVPRMLFHSISAGVLWTTYEYFKFLFGAKDPLTKGT